ncbi:MAG: HDOD domain-containing protein [Gammaproteobacteria bacterium]|nr:HDOD domain-containing protein [Gammaproteobacteria bacterium]
MKEATSTAKQDIGNMLEEAVRDIGIPPRPAVLERINTEMRRPEPDSGRLAGIISADVSLSAGLMKIRQLAVFRIARACAHGPAGLLALGLDTASRAATGPGAAQHLSADCLAGALWDASARIAQISGWMCSRIGLEESVTPGDAYTFGLFRDCGIALMMRRFRDYGDTLRLANDNNERCFTAIELEHHPSNHAVVGCLLARTWWLPEQSCLAIRHHHDIPAIAAGAVALPRESAILIAIAQFAERALQLESGLSHTCEWEKMGPLCLELLGINTVREAKSETRWPPRS